MEEGSKGRRDFLKAGVVSTVAASLPRTRAEADERGAGRNELKLSRELRELVRDTFGQSGGRIVLSPKMNLLGPATAENGRVVPISVVDPPARVSKLAIFVDGLDRPLDRPRVATFELFPGANLRVGTVLRVSRTSRVIAVAETPGGLIGAEFLVRVTIGCGA